MTWNDARPLTTDPGRALATEVSDFPARAYEIVNGALEGLSYIDCLAVDLDASGGPQLRDAYLRGLAAAAIVSDAALGEREYTSAKDYAVHGEEVEFLPTGATLGMLTLAVTAMGQSAWAVTVLGKDSAAPVPQGHRELADALRLKLQGAARASVRRVPCDD